MIRRISLFVLVCLAALSLAACGALEGQEGEAVAQQPPAAQDTAVPGQAEQEQPAAPTAEPTLPPAPTDPPASPTPPPTATTMPTTAPTATATPTTTSTLPPSPTPLPTETPAPTATATVPPPPLPDWLNYLNRFRVMAGLTPVTDWEPYTIGSELHSEYMVINDAAIAHSQDPNNPLFDPAGDQAARNGNIFATSQLDANFIWSINFWASAPFHLIGMLDPNLSLVGYGDHNAAGGDVSMAAVLDVGSDKSLKTSLEYPVLFPGPGTKTWIVRHSMYEWPDPVTSCPGYSRPTGAPIILYMGNGSTTPRVANHRLALGDTPLESCIFDETNYRNPDPWAEKVGRTILNLNDAVVILPRQPLAADATYTVQVTANSDIYTWQFHTIKRPD